MQSFRSNEQAEQDAFLQFIKNNNVKPQVIEHLKQIQVLRERAQGNPFMIQGVDALLEKTMPVAVSFQRVQDSFDAFGPSRDDLASSYQSAQQSRGNAFTSCCNIASLFKRAKAWFVGHKKLITIVFMAALFFYSLAQGASTRKYPTYSHFADLKHTGCNGDRLGLTDLQLDFLGGSPLMFCFGAGSETSGESRLWSGMTSEWLSPSTTVGIDADALHLMNAHILELIGDSRATSAPRAFTIASGPPAFEVMEELSVPIDACVDDPYCRLGIQSDCCRHGLGVMPSTLWASNHHLRDVSDICRTDANTPCLPCAQGQRALPCGSIESLAHLGGTWTVYSCTIDDDHQEAIANHRASMAQLQCLGSTRAVQWLDGECVCERGYAGPVCELSLGTCVSRLEKHNETYMCDGLVDTTPRNAFTKWFTSDTSIANTSEARTCGYDAHAVVSYDANESTCDCNCCGVSSIDGRTYCAGATLAAIGSSVRKENQRELGFASGNEWYSADYGSLLTTRSQAA